MNYVNEKGAILMNGKKPPKGRIEDVFIHFSSEVENNVTIGRGTKIWRWCHVESYSMIGENCMLGMGVHIGPGVKIGNGVRIQDGCSIYRGVTLEDRVFVGPRVVFTNVRVPKIGRKAEFGDTLIKEGAVLGANCTIIAPCIIGRHAFIGANSVVTKDVPDYALVVGNPARVVKILSPDWSEFDKTTN